MGNALSGDRIPRPQRRALTKNCIQINISTIQKRGLIAPLQPSWAGWEIDWTTLHLGGRRPWWKCKNCGGRCQILYRLEGVIACRPCLNLGYLSQQRSGNPYTYFHSVVVPCFYRRLRSPVLRGANGLLQIPPKPWGMPTEDYERLVSKFCEQYYQVLDRKLTQLNTFAAKSMSQIEGILNQS